MQPNKHKDEVIYTQLWVVPKCCDTGGQDHFDHHTVKKHVKFFIHLYMSYIKISDQENYQELFHNGW